MASKEFLLKLNTIINEEGAYSEMEILYIGESLLQLYKTILKIFEKDGNGTESSPTEQKI